jgi:hypothetical protein
MARMNTKVRYLYDAGALTLLRARTDPAITATADSLEVAMTKSVGEWATPAEPAVETFAVVINVTAFDKTTGDETYVITVKATNGAGAVLAGLSLGTVTVSKIGQYAVLVDVPTALLQDATFDGIKLTATLSGTTPILTYHAWLSMIEGA